MTKARDAASESRPRVAVVSTGGTIAMQEDEGAGGAVPQLGASDFTDALPTGRIRLSAEEVVNLPSSHFTLETLRDVRDRVSQLVEEADVTGVVVTHGTDTMEETAYLIDLTVPEEKPVVLTGAMRTATEVGYDGYANLSAAIRVAASAAARGMGTVIVFNDEIHAARRVTKMHTLSPSTFQSPGWGPVGRVEGDVVIVERRVKRECLPMRGLEPRVELLKLAIGASPDLMEDSLERGVRGVVIEALGGGRVPPWWLASIERARDRGVPVVIASRCPSGPVWDQYGYEGSCRSLSNLGCLFAPSINGQKARVRLMVTLAAADRTDDVRRLWGRTRPSVRQGRR